MKLHVTLIAMSIGALFIAAAAASMGCGGGSPEAKQPEGGGGGGGEHGHEHGDAKHEGKHEGHEEHHAKLSPALKDFHEVLAPVWHTTPGAERVAKACTGSDALRDKAKATGDDGLIASTSTLSKSCTDDKAQVEPTLEKVHHRFHELAEKH